MAIERCVDQAMADVLPWYVNGTLSDEERRSVELHLDGCAACRQELKFLQQIAVVLHAEPPVPRSDLFARTAAAVKPRGWRELVKTARQIVIPIPVYARVVLAAEFAIIVALAAALAPRGSLTTLSETPRQLGPAVQVQIVFNKDATAGLIREALVSLKARIVDGPTPLGVYSVEIPLGAGAVVTTVDEALRKLRASPLIEFAEAVGKKR